MRELTFVERGMVEWREAPAPQLQGAGEVLVRPVAVATCDLDAAIIKGLAPFVGPFPLGHEFIAEVTDIGDAVSGVELGQRFAVPFQICCGVCANCRAAIGAHAAADLEGHGEALPELYAADGIADVGYFGDELVAQRKWPDKGGQPLDDGCVEVAGGDRHGTYQHLACALQLWCGSLAPLDHSPLDERQLAHAQAPL